MKKQFLGALLVFTVLFLSACSVGDLINEPPVDTPTELPPTMNPTEVEDQEPAPTPIPPTEVPPPTAEPTVTPRPSGITIDNAHSLVEKQAVNIGPSAIFTSPFSPSANQFATFGYDKVIRIFDAENGSLIREMNGHTENGFSLYYSADGTKLISGAGDYTVRVWDVETGDLLTTTRTGSDVYRAVFSPDGEQIAVVGNFSSRIQILDANTGGEITTLQPSNIVKWALAYSGDGKW